MLLHLALRAARESSEGHVQKHPLEDGDVSGTYYCIPHPILIPHFPPGHGAGLHGQGGPGARVRSVRGLGRGASSQVHILFKTRVP